MGVVSKSELCILFNTYKPVLNLMHKFMHQFKHRLVRTQGKGN
ncbi:hypothetical protein BH10CYA1_BH10CYA1_37960 [soil metagenome]